jgi:HPt (histidine-containing phosphotransfer) domain-containing protein
LQDVHVQNSAASSIDREIDPSPEVLDAQHLSRQTFGDLELERDILALFREQCQKLLPVISGNCQLPSRVDAAHTLKGGARAVGAVVVARVADEIESALRRHGELSRGQSDALSRCIVDIRAAIDARLGQRSL